MLQTYEIDDPRLARRRTILHRELRGGLEQRFEPVLIAMLDAYDEVARRTRTIICRRPGWRVPEQRRWALRHGERRRESDRDVRPRPLLRHDQRDHRRHSPAIHQCSSVYVGTGGGSGTIDASGFTVPLTAYAGSGTDTIIGGHGSIAVDQRLKITSLTFLFTDLKGSTELYDRVGDLAAYDLVNAHFRALQDIVAAEAGAVVKTIGDAVMATFPTRTAPWPPPCVCAPRCANWEPTSS